MSKQTTSMVKGLATGLAVGTATYMISSAMGNNNKALKRNAGKAIRAVGTIIDNVTSMMR